jgi:competence ComEA-like helix-hairpin-helix protein
MNLRTGIARSAMFAAVVGGSLLVAVAQQTDWPVYGHDAGGQRFSPNRQINAGNVQKLQKAWTIDTGEVAQFLETTPIVVDGTLYFTTPSQIVVAASPTTGEMKWRFDPHVTRPFHQRGVTYWSGDAQHAPRIIFATTDGRMIALDAKTGELIKSFGHQGTVELKLGVATPEDPNPRLTISSPPVLYKNFLILGPETQEGPSHGPSGDPRAFDVVSGAEVWRFHTVPRPGEPGNKSWGPDGWVNRAGPSAWGLFTVDTKRGLVFIPTGNPADNMYGADRKGMNLYSCSVLALNAETGKLVWSYQIVHHDIWDYDVAAAPALIDVVHQGKRIPAVVEIGKNGLMYILDEMTGKPIYGVKERPVPKSDVPGEESWPTQPFPLKPPPLSRMSINAQELNKLTPDSESFCRDLFAKMHNDGAYTPYGTKPTVVFPGTVGGGNWNGVSFDPQLGYIYTNVSNIGAMGQMIPSNSGPELYRNATAYARFRDQHNYPCNQPPWGELIAVNANTGDIAWKSVLGEYPELAAKGIKNTGAPNLGGSIVTAGGVVFVGATADKGFRAFDAHTGRLLWSTTLDGYANATPITYMGDDGKQYVVTSQGGPGFEGTFLEHSKPMDGKIVAFVLPPVPPQSAQVVKLPVPEGGRNLLPFPRRAPGEVEAGENNVETGPAGQVPGFVSGELALQKNCLKCHGMGTITAHHYSGANWIEKLNEMVSLGATGTPLEIRAIEQYLTANYGEPVNVNTASASQLKSGLLLSTQDAEAIVAFRSKNGPFRDLQQLESVPGINASQIRDQSRNIQLQ